MAPACDWPAPCPLPRAPGEPGSEHQGRRPASWSPRLLAHAGKRARPAPLPSPSGCGFLPSCQDGLSPRPRREEKAAFVGPPSRKGTTGRPRRGASEPLVATGLGLCGGKRGRFPALRGGPRRARWPSRLFLPRVSPRAAAGGSPAVPEQGRCGGPQPPHVCTTAGSLGLGGKVTAPGLQVRTPRPGGCGRAAAWKGLGAAAPPAPAHWGAQLTSARPHRRGC